MISIGNQIFCICGTCLHMSSLDQVRIPPHKYIQNLQSRSCRSHFRKDCPRNIHQYLQVIQSGDKVSGDEMGSDTDTTFHSVLVLGSALSCLVLLFLQGRNVQSYKSQVYTESLPLLNGRDNERSDRPALYFPCGFLQPVLREK